MARSLPGVAAVTVRVGTLDDIPALVALGRAVVPPTAVFAASSDWGAASAGAALGARIQRAGAEFADLVARSERSLTVRDPFAIDGDFAARIGGGAT